MRVYGTKRDRMAAGIKVNREGSDGLTSEDIFFPSLGTEGLFQVQGVGFSLVNTYGKA